jgi:nicotinate-nucleotide pyrophosphorylase (carboxylating)
MTQPQDLNFPDSDWVRELVQRSLAEDIGAGDVSTSLSIPANTASKARIMVRREGVVAGLPLVEMVYGELSGDIRLSVGIPDGGAVRRGDCVATLSGPTAVLLTGERTALNFLQHLSGIASLTARYVAAVAGTGCRILDTRKTLPGMRALAKYAVRAGGGSNHRMGLYDRIMLKDNHWGAASASMRELVLEARRAHPGLAIEVEVDSLEQLEEILPLAVDWILLDNFTPREIATAVRRRDEVAGPRAILLEASGNIDLENVREYAEGGVDAVSIGRLTHSAPALDLGLDIIGPTPVQKGRRS